VVGETMSGIHDFAKENRSLLKKLPSLRSSTMCHIPDAKIISDHPSIAQQLIHFTEEYSLRGGSRYTERGCALKIAQRCADNMCYDKTYKDRTGSTIATPHTGIKTELLQQEIKDLCPTLVILSNTLHRVGLDGDYLVDLSGRAVSTPVSVLPTGSIKLDRESMSLEVYVEHHFISTNGRVLWYADYNGAEKSRQDVLNILPKIFGLSPNSIFLMNITGTRFEQVDNALAFLTEKLRGIGLKCEVKYHDNRPIGFTIIEVTKA
jgi:hypothetical protein